MTTSLSRRLQCFAAALLAVACTDRDEAANERAAARFLAALEGGIQSQVAALYDRLSGHWRAIYMLIVASLVLAASKLALLRLAHRRRLELEQARSSRPTARPSVSRHRTR